MLCLLIDAVKWKQKQPPLGSLQTQTKVFDINRFAKNYDFSVEMKLRKLAFTHKVQNF